MNFAEKAFIELFPDKEPPKIKYHYSGKFGMYNANARKSYNTIEFGLSKSWRGINESIKIGLIQNLLLKLYKIRKKTINIDLYENFTKNIHLSIPKNKSDPILEESFHKINERYFNGLIEKPNLKWGNSSKSTLGTYNYHNDTITISGILRNAPKIFVDYVIYHEILHKKIKFYTKSGRSYHHSTKFRNFEKKFEKQKIVEKELRDFLKGKHMPRKRTWWFI